MILFFRSATQSPATGLLPLLPARWPVYRRSRRSPRRHHPATVRLVLPLFRRGAAGHLARCPAGSGLQVTPDLVLDRRHLLEGLCGYLPVHILRAEELMWRLRSKGKKVPGKGGK